MNKFLITDKNELKIKGWKQLDIILISGDAYIDHPSFGSVLIARYLEYNGFKVGIISQPDWRNNRDFLKLGRPKLFFGITSGNMDSMVNHYTAQKKIRSSDAYSPGGKTGLRPNRATIVYTQKVRSLFKGVPIVIGGIEASLRRLPHYDFQGDKLRNSILFDSKADILVYGMGERTILNIANDLNNGKSIQSLSAIKGTVITFGNYEGGVRLPEYTKFFSKEQFRKMHKIFEDNYRENVIVQKFGNRLLIHNPPAKPLSQNEMDNIYNLPFTREPHPMYSGNEIPAFKQICNSVTSHRGCFGGCNFCSLAFHQGKTIRSRSMDSIKNEIGVISKNKHFKGTISDIGGPTANMFGMSCKINLSETCKRTSCIYPSFCSNLDYSHRKQKKLLAEAMKLSKIRHLFISSGIRFDLALKDEGYIRQIAEHHTGGLLKLAPEHKSEKVLKFMKKPGFKQYEEFRKIFTDHSNKMGKKQYIVPYIIVGHPGSTLEDTIELAVYLKNNNIKLEQIQEFTPTPMTVSTLMYYTGKDMNGKKITVPKGREIRLRKALVQWFEPWNRKLIIEALKKAKRNDLIGFFLD